MGSVKMKNFSFGMFDYKTKLFKKICQYIVTTIKLTVWNVKGIALRSEKSIVSKGNDKNWNF